MSNRRDFLKNLSMLTAGGLFLGNTSCTNAPKANAVDEASAAKPSKRLGLQIYSLQKELYDDLPNRLKEVKAMGYETLELAGYNAGKIGGVDMMEFKKMADDAGLQIISSHVNPTDPSVTDPFKAMIRQYSKEVTPKIMDYWKATAADHAKLGCKYLIQPMMPSIATEVTTDSATMSALTLPSALSRLHRAATAFRAVVPTSIARMPA